MNRSNPQFVLRNWLVQDAIDTAHADDFRKVQWLLVVMERLFDEPFEPEDRAQKRPDWARNKPGCPTPPCSSRVGATQLAAGHLSSAASAGAAHRASG